MNTILFGLIMLGVGFYLGFQASVMLTQYSIDKGYMTIKSNEDEDDG